MQKTTKMVLTEDSTKKPTLKMSDTLSRTGYR